MVIYGDILFILNTVIDYLLLGVVLSVIRTRVRLARRLASAVLGGLSSFYIFIESGFLIIDILYRLIVSVIMIIILLGIINFKKFIKGFLYYIGFSFLLGGVSELAVNLFSVKTVLASKGYLYVGISPILLIGLTVVFYIVLKLIVRLNKNNVNIEKAEIVINLNSQTGEFEALVDSGNSITDVFSESEILIVSDRVIKKLCKTELSEYLKINKSRCRIVPANTVNGESVLYGVRCDMADISADGKKLRLQKPILALSKQLKNEEYDVIISKGIFDNENFR